MRIEALSKALTSFDMLDIFQIIPEDMTLKLSSALTNLFDCQTGEQQLANALSFDPIDIVQTVLLATRQTATSRAEAQLVLIEIKLINLVTSFQDLQESAICQSNKYYAIYGTATTVENLA